MWIEFHILSSLITVIQKQFNVPFVVTDSTWGWSFDILSVVSSGLSSFLFVLMLTSAKWKKWWYSRIVLDKFFPFTPYEAYRQRELFLTFCRFYWICNGTWFTTPTSVIFVSAIIGLYNQRTICFRGTKRIIFTFLWCFFIIILK